jgi:hypothetical protein
MFYFTFLCVYQLGKPKINFLFYLFYNRFSLLFTVLYEFVCLKDAFALRVFKYEIVFDTLHAL